MQRLYNCTTARKCLINFRTKSKLIDKGTWRENGLNLKAHFDMKVQLCYRALH